jgi:hypothetical protein
MAEMDEIFWDDVRDDFAFETQYFDHKELD